MTPEPPAPAVDEAKRPSTFASFAVPNFRRFVAGQSISLVGFGSTPIGSTIIGAIGAGSARLAVGVGAIACAAAALLGVVAVRRHQPLEPSA